MAKAKELKELGEWKVGQEVIVYGSGFAHTNTISKITRITDGRGGTIYIEKTAYDRWKHERTSDSWYSKYIKIATESDKEEVIQESQKRKLDNFKWNTLPGSLATEIITLMRNKGIKI